MKDEYYEFDEQKFLKEYPFESWEYHTDKVAECKSCMPFIYQNDNFIVRGDVFIIGQPEFDTFFKVIRVNREPNGDYKSIGSCRISMINPAYVTGYDENMTLTNDEIDEIINMFTENNNIGWKMLLEQTNYALESVDRAPIFDVNNYPMPNYELLKKVR